MRNDDVEDIAAEYCDPIAVGEHNWTGEERDASEIAERMRQALERDGLLGAQSGTLVVELTDGTRVGDASWRTGRWGPSAKSACPSIGITLLPDHRGNGYGTIAQRLLIDHLFQNTAAHRVQSDTAADNPAAGEPDQ